MGKEDQRRFSREFKLGVIERMASGEAGSGQAQMSESIAAPAPLPYQPPRQGGSVCWTCGEAGPQSSR
jgi:hypothetical protein